MSTWFTIHIIVGLCFPFVVFAHMGFVIFSINGALAFYTMIAVVISGIIGRFIMLRVGQKKIMSTVFEYWHVFHIPVVYFMVFFVILHVFSVFMF